MQLTDLLNDEKDFSFTGITSDSRKVKKGFLFAALPGSTADGVKFIADAIAHGASFVLAQTGASLPVDGAVIC